MKPIPEIVKEHVLKNCGRMPDTDKEIDDYLDLINHAKEYAEAVKWETILGKRGAKRFGFKSKDEVKKEGKNLFKHKP